MARLTFEEWFKSRPGPHTANEAWHARDTEVAALEQEAKGGEAAALRLVADYCDAFNQPPNISIAAAKIKRYVEGLIPSAPAEEIDACRLCGCKGIRSTGACTCACHFGLSDAPIEND
jgi:hypothetical protein